MLMMLIPLLTVAVSWGDQKSRLNGIEAAMIKEDAATRENLKTIVSKQDFFTGDIAEIKAGVGVTNNEIGHMQKAQAEQTKLLNQLLLESRRP